MKLQQFNGGVNSRLAPQLLQLNQGVVFDNLDIAKGSLSPLKDKASTGPATEKYAVFFDAEQAWYSSSVETDYLEFQGNLYWTDGIQPKKRVNGVTNNLGIARPAAAPTVAAQFLVTPIQEFAVSSDASGNLPFTDLQYLIVNQKNGVKAAPFNYTVYTSKTVISRADGELLTLSSSGFYASIPFRGGTITTAPGTGRRIIFEQFRGEIGDKCTIYRKYNNKWYEVDEIFALSHTVVDDVEDISANAELDLDEFSAFNGTYQYLYTYYNNNDGTESAPSPLSTELKLDSGEVFLSNMSVSSDPQVTHKRIYRVGANLTEFTLVAQISNITESYVDGLKDSEVLGDLLESDNYYEAPTNLRYLSESYAMLFGAVGSTLRFTPVGKPNAWPPEYSIEFDSTITGLGPVANGLLVMTKFSTFIVTGTGPLSLAQQPLRGDQGCLDFKSVQQVTQGMLCWASADGLCVSSGNNVTVITKDAFNKLSLNVAASAVVDEVYYCLQTDGTAIVWDFRFGTLFYTLSLGVESLAVANSEVYGWSAGSQLQLFASDSNLTFSYISPRLTEGSLTKPKTYKKVYFSFEGAIIINVLINDKVVVANKQLTGSGVEEVLVPQNEQRGYYIQFQISGTGEVNEIEYEVGFNR